MKPLAHSLDRSFEPAIDRMMFPGLIHVRTSADQHPPRNRRSTDLGGHCDNVRTMRSTTDAEQYPIVVQRAGGPLHDWAFDHHVNDDLTPLHGIDRRAVDVDGWLRTSIG